MPNFFILLTSKHDTRKSEDTNDDTNDEVQKITDKVTAASIQLFQKWMTDELQAQRIIQSGGTLPASEQTQARINFQDAGIGEAGVDKLVGIADGTVNAEDCPKPLVNIESGPIDDPVAISAYFIVKQDSMQAALDWAKTAPIFGPNMSFDIRQLLEDVEDEPSRDFVVEQVVSIREKLVQEGKMKINQDGTHWVKVDDKEDLKDDELAEKIAAMELKSEILSKARGSD